jgi:hypothetical protein
MSNLMFSFFVVYVVVPSTSVVTNIFLLTKTVVHES